MGHSPVSSRMASLPDQNGEPGRPPGTEQLPMAEKHYPRLLVSNLNPSDSRVSKAGMIHPL